MTIIETRPFRNGWKCFEAPGVEPVFLDQEDAIDHATGRACFRSGEIRVLDSDGAIEQVIPFNEYGRRAYAQKLRWMVKGCDISRAQTVVQPNKDLILHELPHIERVFALRRGSHPLIDRRLQVEGFDLCREVRKLIRRD